MEFRTEVAIPPSAIRIVPQERMLFVGSCFAEGIGERAQRERFRAVVNPFGVMYNPASVLHTVSRLFDGEEPGWPFAEGEAGLAVMSLGTNHVYILNETGEIVDNCRKRPQRLFTERELTVDECVDHLLRAVETIHAASPQVDVLLTVSPIRYRKYGYHASQLSKSVLLLAADRVVRECAARRQGRDGMGVVEYFPSYEIVLDELRDYRFYAPDMLHPSAQAADYIWERLAATMFTAETRAFISEWRPIREALAHRPLHPDFDEWRDFRRKAEQRLEEFNSIHNV